MYIVQITVFRVGEATQDIDLAILAALLKSTYNATSLCKQNTVHSVLIVLILCVSCTAQTKINLFNSNRSFSYLFYSIFIVYESSVAK